MGSLRISLAASDRKCRLRQAVKKYQKAYHWMPGNAVLPLKTQVLTTCLLSVSSLKGLIFLIVATWLPVMAGAAYIPVSILSL